MKELTSGERRGILELADPNNPRYPTTISYVAKGKDAFDLHLRMVHLVDGFADKQKEGAILVVLIQQTISKARAKNPDSVQKKPVERMKLVLLMKGEIPVNSGQAMSKSKKWLEELDEFRKTHGVSLMWDY